MQQIKNPYIRLLIHLFLIMWVLYSVVPFVWTIMGSFQFTRDAIARNPRYVPEIFVNNSLTIAAILTLLILGGFFISRRQTGGDDDTVQGNLPNFAAYGTLIAALLLVVGGFLLLLPTSEAELEYLCRPRSRENL